MKVVAYNIHGWRTVEGAPNLDLVSAVIAASGADLVALNEVYHPFDAAAGRPVLAELAGRLGMDFAFGATQAAADARLPAPYGNALLSRWPIQAFAAHHLAPETDYGRRGMLEARVRLPGGRPFTAYVIHLDHRREPLRLEQWAAASTWLQRDRGRPHLLMGDFNALTQEDYAGERALALEEHNRANGWLAPRFDLMAQVARAGYVDAFVQAGSGGFETYLARTPERRIDYILASGPLRAAVVACRRIESAEARDASDHLPVWAEIADP
jgi:endonuclease/exonuclease/phosphatase family metal-dependent hydrolase